MSNNKPCELDQKKWTLEQLKEWQEICLHCGACIGHGPIIPHNNEELPPDYWQSPERKCPSLEYYKLKTFSGQGRLLLTAAVFRERTDITDDLTNIMYTCNSCGVCDEICPPYLPMHVTLACREEINEKGLPIPEPLPELFENMENKQNLFGLEKRAKSLPDLPETGTDLYFSGCYTSYLLPEIGKVNGELLRLGGLDVCHLGSAESCCGEVARQAGNRLLFEKIAREQISKVEATGAKRVICSCAHCYKTWKEEYPRAIQGELPFEVVHVTQVLLDLIREGKLKPLIPVEKEITYHDPCFLRGSCHEEPRAILEEIPGITLIEMERHGRWSYCCGAGAKIALNCYPDYADAIGKERVNEAVNAAEQVITACPVCYNQLRFTAKTDEVNLLVEDISILLAQSVGIEIEKN